MRTNGVRLKADTTYAYVASDFSRTKYVASAFRRTKGGLC